MMLALPSTGRWSLWSSTTTGSIKRPCAGWPSDSCRRLRSSTTSPSRTPPTVRLQVRRDGRVQPVRPTPTSHAHCDMGDRGTRRIEVDNDDLLRLSLGLYREGLNAGSPFYA